ncbi:MAG: histidinol-phosphatase HisJ family protein [Candidatus Zapsychrus exili]|nr:histidinol-phosphatase HisJ family protein [Candidatus Zapsychrus exili]
MIPIYDYHMHTFLCGHATGEPKDYVERAISLGLKEVGFSDHAPFLSHVDPSVTMGIDKLLDYYKMISDLKEEYKDKISIKIGIEADYMPDYEEKTKELLALYSFDYILGSVHFIESWGFDNPDERPKWDKQDINSIYFAYHKLLRKSAETGMFDIMAHVDLLKKFGDRATKDLSGEVNATARVFKECGVAIEINSSGLRKPIGEIYPSLPELKIYCNEGVPIVFGSDAHTPEQVGMDFDKAVAAAREAGYKEYLVFENRKVARTEKL